MGDIRDTGSIPGSGRSLGGGHGNPLQYSSLENRMDRGAWRTTLLGVTKSRTWLKQLSTHAQEHPKVMLQISLERSCHGPSLFSRLLEIESLIYLSLMISCFQFVVLEKTFESPLVCKEIRPVNPKRNQLWIFIGKTDAEAEAPLPRPPDAKSWLIEKDPDAGEDWGQEEKGTIEDKMVGWHHWLSAHKFEQTPGDSEGQESIACCSSWGHKESDMT